MGLASGHKHKTQGWSNKGKVKWLFAVYFKIDFVSKNFV